MLSQISQLETKLKRAKNSGQRFSILISLSREYARKDGTVALAYAEEALSLSGPRNTHNKIQGLRHVAEAHFFLGNYETSLQFYNDAQELAESMGAEIEQAIIYSNKSHVLKATGRFTEAKEYIERSYGLYAKHGERVPMAQALRKIADIYIIFLDFRRAFESLRQASDLIQGESDPVGEAIILESMGNLYDDTNEPQKALDCYHQALIIVRKIEHRYLEATICTDIGKVYAELGQFDLALSHFQQSIAIQHDQNNIAHEVIGYSNLSDLYLHVGNSAEALAIAEHCKALVQSTTHRYANIASDMQLGKVLNALGRYEEALPPLFRALTYLEDGSDLITKSEIISQIIFAFEHENEYKQALNYHKQLLDIQIDIQQKKADRDLKQSKLQFETEMKEAEKEVYRLKAEQLERENKLHAQEVALLGLEIIQKNEFLQLIKKEAKELATVSPDRQNLLRNFVKQIEGRLNSDEARTLFNNALRELHYDFFSQLEEHYPLLTKTELKISSLLKLRLGTQEIAHLLHASIRTIEWHRFNIRKKLQVPNEMDLTFFFDTKLLS